MDKNHKAWFAPVITGTIAAVFGGLLLVWLTGPQELSINVKMPSDQAQNASGFPKPSVKIWSAMQNEAPYARNYSRIAKRPYEQHNQVITVFETKMSSDRRIGKEIATGVYLEIFKVGAPNLITVRVRVDRGHYWLLSRQTIRLNENQDLISHNPEKTIDSFRQFQLRFQNEIDTTRHLLARL